MPDFQVEKSTSTREFICKDLRFFSKNDVRFLMQFTAAVYFFLITLRFSAVESEHRPNTHNYVTFYCPFGIIIVKVRLIRSADCNSINNLIPIK